MKKFLLSAFVILAFGTYAIYQRLSPASRVVVSVPVSITQNSPVSLDSPVKTPVNQTKKSSVSSVSSSSSSSTQSTLYKNGTYTGSSADAYYGSVQVRATIQNGKITDVVFLDYPHDRSTSAAINRQAMPYLKQEAIQAQSANVNGVSGATMTSDAFIQSLSSALNQAKG